MPKNTAGRTGRRAAPARSDIAPGQTKNIEQHKDQAKRHQHLRHRPGMPHMPNQAEIERRAHAHHDHRRNHQRAPIAEPGGDADADKGAERVQRAMRQIDEMQQPEDHGEADRQQEQQHRKLEAVQKLNDPELCISRHVQRPNPTPSPPDDAARAAGGGRRYLTQPLTLSCTAST